MLLLEQLMVSEQKNNSMLKYNKPAFKMNLDFVWVEKTVVPTRPVGPDVDRRASTVATLGSAVAPPPVYCLPCSIYLGGAPRPPTLH